MYGQCVSDDAAGGIIPVSSVPCLCGRRDRLRFITALVCASAHFCPGDDRAKFDVNVNLGI